MAFPYHSSPTYPAVPDLEEYDKVRSIKVDKLMTILRWHLYSDDHGVYKDLDKELSQEEQESVENEWDMDTDPDYVGPHALEQDLPELMTMGKRKILVFTEFAMMAPLLKSVSLL